MINKVQIRFNIANNKYVMKRIIDYKINIYSSKTINNCEYYVINYNDYELLKKLDYKNAIEFVRYYGKKNVTHNLRTNLEKILVSISIIMIIFLSKLWIFKVNVFVDDIFLKRVVSYALIDKGIKDNSLMKSFNELGKIKSDILTQFSNEIEWLEISKNGYEYNVRIIRREKNNINETSARCNYVAYKSGTIKSIIVKKGVLMVQENNFVNAGDILINGDIIYNEELKTSVCAEGKITGEVWYKVNVSYPLKKTKTYWKKDGMYNLTLRVFNKNYKVFKDKYQKPRKIFNLGGNFLGLRVTKSQKSYQKIISYTESEALKKAINIARKQVQIKAPKKSSILSENILKKTIKDDKISLEVLITVEEELGVVENY